MFPHLLNKEMFMHIVLKAIEYIDNEEKQKTINSIFDMYITSLQAQEVKLDYKIVRLVCVIEALSYELSVCGHNHNNKEYSSNKLWDSRTAYVNISTALMNLGVPDHGHMFHKFMKQHSFEVSSLKQSNMYMQIKELINWRNRFVHYDRKYSKFVERINDHERYGLYILAKMLCDLLILSFIGWKWGYKNRFGRVKENSLFEIVPWASSSSNCCPLSPGGSADSGGTKNAEDHQHHKDTN